MRRRPCIAIDGPVGAGKSTIARLVAGALGYRYVDSGAMYRALAWAAQQQGIAAGDTPQVLGLLHHLHPRLAPQAEGRNRVFVDEREITEEIRTQQVGELASRLSEVPEERRQMVALQQEMAGEGGVVMEGRDIQTVVLPEAEVKIFLTAPAEERAQRRMLELRERGDAADLASVLAEIKARDERDTSRAHSPLRAAPEAVRIDTGGLTIEQVVERVLKVVRAREQT